MEESASPGNGKVVHAGFEAQPKAYYSCAYTFEADDKMVSTILYYLDYHQPIWCEFPLPDGNFKAELIDPWAMTVTPIDGEFSKAAKLQLPARPNQAIRFRRL